MGRIDVGEYHAVLLAEITREAALGKQQATTLL
jgi:hypothetical protein